MKREFIINWFLNNSTLSEADIEKNMEENFFDLGIIDSFGFLELIGECEEKLDIAFDDEDFQNDSIFTIKGLIGLVEKK